MPLRSAALIKARSIDDVPILAMTLGGEHYNGYQLRAIADEMQHNIAQISDVSETTIIGGLPLHHARGAVCVEKRALGGFVAMAICWAFAGHKCERAGWEFFR